MIRYRAKCCDNMQDFKDEKAICPKCNQTILSLTQGRLTIKRKAMYMCCDKKFEIFFNGESWGEIICNQTITFCLPYGVYTLHFKCGEAIKCKDITIEITPEKPITYILTAIKMHFWSNSISIEECDKEDLD